MKLKFQVLRHGETIFDMTVEESNLHELPNLTGAILHRFQKYHPQISLLDEYVILKWSKDPSG